MPDLAHSLRDHDFEHLTNIAELWGIEINASDVRETVTQLTKAVLNPDLIQEIISSLSGDSRLTIAALQARQGRLPWAQFTRRYGQLRDMGPGRRTRLKPHRNPQSTPETLWYHGIIARAFFDTPSGANEFAYIPDDLRKLLPSLKNDVKQVFGRLAQKEESAQTIPSHDRILDHACTVLAALRLEKNPDELRGISSNWQVSSDFLIAVLTSAGILDTHALPISKATRAFLESDRASALHQLVQAWRNSETLNDLVMVPHLEMEGHWKNNPLETRLAIMAFLQQIPQDKWWSMAAFISDIHQAQPDFQRPAGDYDSWYLKDARTGEYVRGFEHWHEVEGAFLRWIIAGPLHWLGVLDLASPGQDESFSAFRFSSIGLELLDGENSNKPVKEDAKLNVDSQGRLSIPHLFPRAARYQIARFCEWGEERAGVYSYRITPASLGRALSQGLTLKQFQVLLHSHAAHPPPPNLLTALDRWGQHGAQASIESLVVLRVASPDILKELQTSRAARFLGDPIGPTTVQVKPGAWEKVMDALAMLGYLGSADDDLKE